jgi:hypothetical protein
VAATVRTVSPLARSRLEDEPAARGRSEARSEVPPRLSFSKAAEDAKVHLRFPKRAPSPAALDELECLHKEMKRRTRVVRIFPPDR